MQQQCSTAVPNRQCRSQLLCSPKTSLALAFADMAAALLKFLLPSELRPGDITPCKGRPLLLNGRLGNAAHGLPSALQHPAFGTFLDWAQGRPRLHPRAMQAGPLPAPSPDGQQPSPGVQRQPDQEDMEAAAALCSIAYEYYEDEMGKQGARRLSAVCPLALLISSWRPLPATSTSIRAAQASSLVTRHLRRRSGRGPEGSSDWHPPARPFVSYASFAFPSQALPGRLRAGGAAGAPGTTAADVPGRGGVGPAVWPFLAAGRAPGEARLVSKERKG